MIIPPDPEKDPRLFLTSSSTPSLLLPPDSDSDLSPANANAISAVDYPYNPFGDDASVRSGVGGGGDGDIGEFLPPYERRSRGVPGDVPGGLAGGREGETEMRERERSAGYIGITIPSTGHGPGAGMGLGMAGTGMWMGIRGMNIAESEGSITPTASTYASGSTARFPTIPSDTDTAVGAGSSTAKLWEGSSSSPPSSSGATPQQGNRNASASASAQWKGKSRAFMGLPTKSESEKDPLSTGTARGTRRSRWWKKYRRWVWGLGILGLVGVGLMIGLLAGLRGTLFKVEGPPVPSGPAWHDVEPGDSRWNMAWADGSMNLTWTQGRDAPPASDGVLTDCNTFTPFNTSDPSTNFSSLSTPYPSNKLWVSTYLIPLQRINMTAVPYTLIPSPDTFSGNSTKSTSGTSGSATAPVPRAATTGFNASTSASASAFPLGLLAQLPILSRGIASSGTVEIIGRDAADEVIQGGSEGNVRVDVVVQYGGAQGVAGIMRVCEVTQVGGGVGVGVYTPIVTDGKISNPYTLDPTQLPSFHIIVRLPPSLFSSPSFASSPSSAPSAGAGPPGRPLYIADMALRLDKMGVRVGNLAGIVDFGSWNVTSDRGGAVVDYVAAERVWVQTAENAVRGRFNVSKSLNINSTDSSIVADIILHDPSSTLNTSLSRSFVASRGLPPSSSFNTTTYLPLPPSDLATSLANSTASVLTHNFTHTVNTTFHTTDGLIRLKYISHPPTTALLSWTSLSSGEMDVSVHPNYVGPFAIKNAWGMVRLPPIRSGEYDDPLGTGRRRAIVQGAIGIEDGSLFARGGMNETLLPQSGTTITGAAYWQEGRNGTLTPQAVQQGEEGRRGSQMVCLGGWGDVTLRFDGT